MDTLESGEDNIPVKFELMPPQEVTYFENAMTNFEIKNKKIFHWNKATGSDVRYRT